MDLQEFKIRFWERKIQASFVSLEGVFQESCNTLVNLSHLKGKNIFDEIDYLVGMNEILEMLREVGNIYEIPAVQLGAQENELIVDVRFSKIEEKGEQVILWLLVDETAVYTSMQKSQQQKNESIIKVEFQKREKQILNAYNAKLESLNQELDNFSRIVSHDLKAPLRGLKNLYTWIQEDLGDDLPKEVAENFQLMDKQVIRMSAKIDAILKYSQVGKQQIELAELDTGEMVREIVASLALPRELKIHIDASMPVFSSYPILLEQVFSNLLSNAVKHHDKPDGNVFVSANELPDWYEFSVKDDGPGIDPIFHERIFQVFQTIKAQNDPENTGIGLATIKKIIKEVGGHIRLESAEGEGSSFIFTWPKS